MRRVESYRQKKTSPESDAMIGKRPAQNPLFDVGNVFDLKLDPKSFHAQLAAAAPKLFKDEDFAVFYKDKMGRPSVPPSWPALATLLQHEAGVSDEEAINRTAFDLRWCAVLGREAGQPLCAKSTFQLFRAHLVLHPEVTTIFQASLKEARRTGLLKGEPLKIALDTKPIRGRGAVQDTFNLLASGIRQLGRVLAQQQGKKPNDFFAEEGLDRYTHDSVKGSADLDWSDEEAENALLTQIVADARRLLAQASASVPSVGAAASLLEQLLLQDVEVKETDKGEQAIVKEGTAKGRMPSATDPDVRHGRKSASKRFNGHKADVAVDQDSQLIVAFAVIAGDAGDASGALLLVAQAEENTELTVIETIADCAYGGGPTRAEFAQAGRTLLAKVPKEVSRNGLFVKSDFDIDLQNDRVRCPAGKTSTTFSTLPGGAKTFTFGSACADCPLRSACTTSQSGRSVSVHPQEARLREARAYQKAPEGKARLRERVVVEHRLARLGQLGIGQARYRSRLNTRFQLILASSLANFRWIWNVEAGRGPISGSLASLLRSSRVLRDCLRLSLALLWHFMLMTTVRTMIRLPFHLAQRAVA